MKQRSIIPRVVQAWPAITAAALLGLTVSPARAQSATAGCEVKSRSDAVVVMVCPASSDADAWRKASIAACGDKPYCNVWIWDDATKAPTSAPARDADMPRSQAGAALAVWANDSKSLLSLKRVAKPKS
jgi:hypothetical protein